MSVKQATIKISAGEHRARGDALRAEIERLRLNGAVLFDRDYVLYYSGFAFVPTERPMAFVMNAKGERRLFVPRLELEHAQANAVVGGVDHYPEYPDDPHPMQVLKGALESMGISGTFAVDQDGYPWIFGYRGPSLSELTGGTVHRI